MSVSLPSMNHTGIRTSKNNLLIMSSRLLLLRLSVPLHSRPELLLPTKTSRPKGANLGRRRQLAGAKLRSRFMHCPEERWRIFKVSSEDLFDHHQGELRHDMVQHDWRISCLIGQTGPVQIGRIPGFPKKTIGISGKGWHGNDIQQFETVVLSHPGMGCAKIVRQALPANLFGVLPTQLLQLLGGASRHPGFFRVLALKLRR